MGGRRRSEAVAVEREKAEGGGLGDLGGWLRPGSGRRSWRRGGVEDTDEDCGSLFIKASAETVDLHMYKWAAAFKNSATAAKPGTPQRRRYSPESKWSGHSAKA